MGERLKNPFSQPEASSADGAAPKGCGEDNFLAFNSSTPAKEVPRGNSWGFFRSGHGKRDNRQSGNQRWDRFAKLGDSPMTPGRGMAGSPTTPRGNRGFNRNWSGSEDVRRGGGGYSPHVNNHSWQPSPRWSTTPQSGGWAGYSSHSNSPYSGRGGGPQSSSPNFNNPAFPRFRGTGRGRRGYHTPTASPRGGGGSGYFKPSMLEDPWAYLTSAAKSRILESAGGIDTPESLPPSSLSESMIPQVGDSMIERVIENEEASSEKSEDGSSKEFDSLNSPSAEADDGVSDSMIPMVGDSILEQEVSTAPEKDNGDTYEAQVAESPPPT